MTISVKKEIERKERQSVLANERTYAAWVRTGLTALATGLGVERFLGGVIPDPFIRVTSMTLLSFSIFSFILGSWRYHHVGSRLKSEEVTGAPTQLLVFLSVVLAFISLLAMIGVWLD